MGYAIDSRLMPADRRFVIYLPPGCRVLRTYGGPPAQPSVEPAAVELGGRWQFITSGHLTVEYSCPDADAIPWLYHNPPRWVRPPDR
jgi:hypothetical protein